MPDEQATAGQGSIIAGLLPVFHQEKLSRARRCAKIPVDAVGIIQQLDDRVSLIIFYPGHTIAGVSALKLNGRQPALVPFFPGRWVSRRVAAECCAKPTCTGHYAPLTDALRAAIGVIQVRPADQVT